MIIQKSFAALLSSLPLTILRTDPSNRICGSASRAPPLNPGPVSEVHAPPARSGDSGPLLRPNKLMPPGCIFQACPALRAPRSTCAFHLARSPWQVRQQHGGLQHLLRDDLSHTPWPQAAPHCRATGSGEISHTWVGSEGLWREALSVKPVHARCG